MKDNIAAFALTVGGQDVARTVIPRLVSLSIEEKLEEGADTLSFTLSNHDGRLSPVRRGVHAEVSLGWKQGSDVTAGLIAKGRFLVDEVVNEGPPDVMRIRARSADLTGAYRKRRDRGWKQTTLGAVIREIARDNNLEPRIHADLAGIAVASVEQAAKSDMAFVRDLGKRHDAAATVKDGKLIFVPIGKGESASGQPLPTLTITRRQTSRWAATEADREDHDGAEAQWHDRGDARRKTVKHGAASNPRRIQRGFSNEAEAKEAARAEASRAARGKFTFTCDLSLGDPAFAPNHHVTLQGWTSQIDATKWLITAATHTLDGSGGYVTSLEMESLG